MPLNPAAAIPVTKWYKALYRIAEAGAYFLVHDLMDYSGQVSAPADLEWRYVVCRFTRPAISGAVEDEAQIGFHLLNVTGGDVDVSWTTGDYTTCEGHLAEWWLSTKAIVASGYTLKEYRWYRKKFHSAIAVGSEALPDSLRFAASGPPLRVTAVGAAGTNATPAGPQQVALSVTFKTGAPGHWGRVYIPGIGADRWDTTGRWTSGVRTVAANSMAELFDDLAGSEFFPVVPVTQVQGVIAPGLLGITSVQVDDIPDVIRRRRAKTTLQRTAGVPTA